MFQIKKVSNQWPFIRYTLIEVETSLLNADVEIMKKFAALVEDDRCREQLMELVVEDYYETLRQIANLFESPADVRRTSQLDNIARRGPILKALHSLQVEILEQWRADSKDEEQQQLLLKRLLKLTNAISGGLKCTG